MNENTEAPTDVRTDAQKFEDALRTVLTTLSRM